MTPLINCPQNNFLIIMSLIKPNSEILNELLEGHNLDSLTARSLMNKWLNDETLDVETGAL